MNMYRLFALLLLIAPMMAGAHALLESAQPRVGSSGPSPAEIRLNFSQEVEARFSSVTLTDQAGKTVNLPKPALDPNDAKVVILPLATPLAPGIYHLEWHALSVDTHHSQGDFRFTVTP
jgi:methionine-rich copper-binding protein CopC